jgi:transcription elongation factor GreA
VPTTAITAAGLLEAVGLSSDGLALLGRPIAAKGPGIYVVELAGPLPSAPIDLNRVGKWIERVLDLRLDGERPTSKALRARLASFWIPSAAVLFIGTAERTIAGRISALDKHVLGDPRPHAAAQWLKVLAVDSLRVRWVETQALEEYEDALIDAFAAAVPEAEREALHDPLLVLPFANQRRPTGERKASGLTGASLPIEVAPAPPETHVVELPPGAADGTVVDVLGSGTTRRTNPTPPVARPKQPAKYEIPSSRPRTPAPRRASEPRVPRAATAAARPASEPVVLTPEGLERSRVELAELLARRPEVIARIRTARELGDLRENADYTAAREEQSFLEGRIQARLRGAVVSETATDSQRVALGSTVSVELGGEEVTFTIVGRTESDPTSGRISDASPVGQALVGRSVGDEAVVRTPAGEARYRVVAIR